MDQMVRDWGTGEYVAAMVPSRANDRDFISWMARLMRATTTPSQVRRYMEASTKADVRDVLQTISQPTLILQPVDYPFFGVEHARYLPRSVAKGKRVERLAS